MRIDLGAGVRTARMKRRRLALRIFRHLAEHLGRPRLVQLRLAPAALVVIAQRFEQSQRSESHDIGRVFRLIERDAHVRLRGEIVNLVGTHLLDDSAQAGAVAQIAVVQLQTLRRARPETLAQMIDSPRRETRSASHHPVHFVVLLQQKLGEIRFILSGHAGYQRYFCHLNSVSAAPKLYHGPPTASTSPSPPTKKARLISPRLLLSHWNAIRI